MIKKFLVLSLVLIMAISFSANIFAAEEEAIVMEINPDDVVYVQEVIGSSEGQTGRLVEAKNGNLLSSEEELFSMTATRVTSLLTTYNSTGKNFLGSDLNYKQAIKITGKVTMSTGEGKNYPIKVGVCYYNPSSDTFISVGYKDFESGKDDTAYIQQYRNGVISGSPTFQRYEKYYGHITNKLSSGYIYGTLTYSLVDNPYAS